MTNAGPSDRIGLKDAPVDGNYQIERKIHKNRNIF